MASLFYYLDNDGRKVGPFPRPEIERFVSAGVIGPDVLISKEGSDNWRQFSDLDSSVGSTEQGSEVDWGQVGVEARKLVKEHKEEILTKVILGLFLIGGLFALVGWIYYQFFFEWF